jgi:hypothetical protein
MKLAQLGPLLDPEMRESTMAVAEMIAEMPALSDGTLADYREAMAQWARPATDTIPVARYLIMGSDGPDLAVYVVNARAGTTRPAVLHMHGGGFVSGAASFDVANLQDLAAALDCVCVTVDYRLAPETDWRGSVADNYAGLRWLYENAAELGADPTRIAVMGESAGGGHAALLAIEARNRAEIRLVLQLLVYPMLDDRTGSSRRLKAGIGTLMWSPESNCYGWRAFLGVEPGGSEAPKAAIPARIKDLSGLAPAFIGVGALDLFAEEDADYAQRLNRAGVAAELHVVAGGVHGFDIISPEASTVKQFIALKLNALRRAFGMPTD